jgi:hypothetical protein
MLSLGDPPGETRARSARFEPSAGELRPARGFPAGSHTAPPTPKAAGSDPGHSVASPGRWRKARTYPGVTKRAGPARAAGHDGLFRLHKGSRSHCRPRPPRTHGVDVNAGGQIPVLKHRRAGSSGCAYDLRPCKRLGCAGCRQDGDPQPRGHVPDKGLGRGPAAIEHPHLPDLTHCTHRLQLRARLDPGS